MAADTEGIATSRASSSSSCGISAVTRSLNDELATDGPSSGMSAMADYNPARLTPGRARR